MTIPIKTEKEIEIMREGGKKLRRVLDYTLGNLKPGITTGEIDRLADKKIKQLGGKPSFRMVPRYHWATCITINEEVVHGIPGSRQIKEGDLVSVDAGIYFKEFHTDAARTILIQSAKGPPAGEAGKRQSEEKKFFKTGEKALEKAIEAAKPGNYIGTISKAIQETIEAGGYSPVRALVGHSVGRKLHEEPPIPCFLDKEEEKTPKLQEGMVLAIEVIYNQGSPEVVLTSDGWTIKTKDGKISSLFEETVAVTAHGPLVLTR